jgi:hypothetical protein
MVGVKAIIFVWHAQWHKPMLGMGTFVEHIGNSLGIEPGTNCEAYVDGMKRKRDGDNTRKKSLKFKKRRNEIHTKRIHCILSSEKKEGKTYETNIGLTLPKLPVPVPLQMKNYFALTYQLIH